MTERVTIEGSGLTVEHHDAPDPKRKRPPTYKPATGDHRTTDDLPEHNPYWSEAANEAAERNPDGLNGKQLAKLYSKHRR